jgi:hypothetical protein
VFWLGADSFSYNGKDVAARLFGLDEASLRGHEAASKNLYSGFQ